MAEILRLRPFQVPARFEFVDPDTHFHYKAANKEALFRQIVDYRAQNRLPPLYKLEYVLEDYWCRKPENAGKCDKCELERTLGQYIRGGIALIENLFYGENNMVSQEEAERRAKICAGCSLNRFPDKGKFLEWSDNMAIACTGGRRTELDDKLGNCFGCSCPLKAKVHFGGDFRLTQKQAKKMLAAMPQCWQVTK